MILSSETIILLFLALGVTFGFLRLFIQGYHQLEKKSNTLLLTLPVLAIFIILLPWFLKLAERDEDWLDVPFLVIGIIFLIWFLKYKKQILPRFSQIHWLVLPASLLFLFIEIFQFNLLMLFFFLFLIFLAGVIVYFPTLVYSQTPTLRKYFYLLFLNFSLSLILFFPIVNLAKTMLVDPSLIKMGNLFTIFLAAGYFPFPFFHVIYFLLISRGKKETHDRYQQRLVKEENFIINYRLYREARTPPFNYIFLCFFVIGMAVVVILGGDPLLLITAGLSLSFFI